MDAAEAWQHTTSGVEKIEAKKHEAALEDALFTEIAKREHLALIAGMVLELHQQIDVKIAEAAEQGGQSIDFVHEDPELLGDTPGEEEFATWNNAREANILLYDQLQQEGFDVRPITVNLQGFARTGWNRYQYNLMISWDAPKPEHERTNAFRRLFAGVVKRP
jgi:hypothetical protein